MSKRIVFEDIKARLLDGENVINDPTFKVKTVRLWNNQLSNLDKEAGFDYPAIFIHYEDLNYRHLTHNIQRFEGSLKLFIVQKEFETENLDNLDFIDKVSRVLGGFQTDNIVSPLRRTGEVQDTDHDQLIVWEQDYQLEALDESGSDFIDAVTIDGGTVVIGQDNSLDIDNDRVRTGDGIE